MFLQALHGDVLGWAKISCISPPPNVDLERIELSESTGGVRLETNGDRVRISVRAKCSAR